MIKKKTAAELRTKIEKMLEGDDYMDALITYCEKEGVELSTIATIIKKNPTLKASIEKSARALNLLT